ncbi:MAG: SGNH/GDSL hydrolase family protein, partial [Butyrivibrio sp.]|nr:SGNH/GDSL hydrolase family protein [Butyrivibrio sp.]
MNEVEGIKRIKKLIDRAKAGEELVLGFFGGSITQGSLSSKPELCYAHRVFDWFKKEFPNAKFHYVNAG